MRFSSPAFMSDPTKYGAPTNNCLANIGSCLIVGEEWELAAPPGVHVEPLGVPDVSL